MQFVCISCSKDFEESCSGRKTGAFQRALCRACTRRIVSEHLDSLPSDVGQVWDKLLTRKESRDKSERKRSRMALTRQEVDKKDLLLQLMRRHNKTEYRVEDMEVKVVVTQEKVKVRILKD